MVDIPGDTSTAVTITVDGGPITNTLEVAGDRDWIRVNLVAGQAITVTLNGVTLVDPYLRIHDSTGAIIHENDDINTGVNLNSSLSFAAPTTGVYYIDVGAYNDAGAGDYQVTVTTWTQPPIFNNDQIATQLTSGYWGDGTHAFTLDASRTITVNITGLNAQGQALARAALLQWGEIAGINFVETSGTAKITFDDDDTGAYTDSNYSGGVISSSFINIDVQWLSDYGPNIGGYAYQAYLHELGHALGLGHAGNYNTTATYPYDVLFRNDAWSTSVMSYFDQVENTYFSGQGFTQAELVTPMVADIVAIGQLYGLSTTTRSGDTTYGLNSNAGGIYDASGNNVTRNNAYTIFDTGGVDTLDYSFTTNNNNQVINLNPETFSNINGRVGNVSIARGTIIENAIGGTQHDTIIGNSVANALTGGLGPDTLTGGVGNDTFLDTRAGLNSDTITDFGIGDRIVFSDATLGNFTFSLSGTTLTYSGGSLTLSAPVFGSIVASAAASGGVQLTIQAAIGNTLHDFNGDGRDDVLLRHTSGTLTDWLGAANGSFTDNWSNFALPLSTGWQVVGTGDFNGDDRDDMLLRHTSGTLTNWLGNANGSFTDNWSNFAQALSTGWQVVGVGDFNGDNRDDLLLRHTSGTLTTWLGNANGSFTDNWSNFAQPLSNEWQVVGVGDFNGGGRDDILLRHSSGTLTTWLGNANGSFTDNWSNFAQALSNEWQVVGVGDFNGGGLDDILLRHTSGTLTDWLGAANGGLTDNWSNFAQPLSSAWQVVGVGDFNGGGRDDILLRHTSGTLTDWLGAANGSFTDNWSNLAQPLPTTWQVELRDYLFP